MENTAEDNQLELLMLLLSDGSACDDDEASMLRWFTEISSQLKDVTADSLEVTSSSGKLKNVPKLMILLRECMLSQRWPEVAHIVRVLTLEPFNTSYSIWKTGTQLMMVDEANSPLLELVIAQLKKLRRLNGKEVVLDYIKYLIVHGRTNDARNTSKMFRRVHRLGEQAQICEGIDDQYKAYQGLLAYVEWLAEKKKAEQMEQDIDEDTFLYHSSGYGHESSMKSFADKALMEFAAIQDKPGVWDIFLDKQVELLEYYNRPDDAYSILSQYRDKHQDNPNAHRNLYQFMKKHEYAEAEQLDILKAYVKMIPSDPLVLDLCQCLRKTEDCNHGDILTYLMAALDYPEWSDKPVIWEQTFHTVKQCTQQCETLSVLKASWQERQGWWPEFHFSQLHSTSDGMMYKLALAVVLMGRVVKIPEHLVTMTEITEAKKLYDIIFEKT